MKGSNGEWLCDVCQGDVSACICLCRCAACEKSRKHLKETQERIRKDMNKSEKEDLEKQKNQAYSERNELVCYLSKIFNGWLEKHPDSDLTWEDDWRNIVFIQFPEGLFSWHIHDSEKWKFDHLKFREGNSWDGSTTQEKYDRLRASVNPLRVKKLPKN